MSISAYIAPVARSSTTSDVFNAVAERRRRQILDLLAQGEKPVNDVVHALHLAQPQVSKHLRVLQEVGLAIRRNWMICSSAPVRSKFKPSLIQNRTRKSERNLRFYLTARFSSRYMSMLLDRYG